VAALALPSAAASDAGAASISSPRLNKGVLTGVLTVRAGQSVAAIDVGSLKAQVGEKAYTVTVKPVAQRKRATMLVVDTSGSMGLAGMATVRTAVAAFLKDAPKDVAVGLVSFAATAGVDVPPTKDRARVQKAVNALRSRGETTLYDGVAVAAAGLQGFEDASILLLSDGGDTRSTKATRSSATADLKRLGVRAEVIGFKTEDSDNSVLKGFAAAGGGSVAAAGDEAAVRRAFEAAAEVLDSQVAFSFAPDAALRSPQTVVVSGRAGGKSFEAKTVVDFGAAPLPTTAAPSQTATLAPDDQEGDAAVATPGQRPGMSAQLLVGLAATGLGILVLGGAMAAPLFASNRRKRVEGIERYVAAGTSVVAKSAPTVTPSALSSNLFNLGDKVMAGRESTTKTMALIERADLPLRAGEWWVLRLVSIVVGVAIGFVLFRGGPGMTLFALVVGAMLGYVLPALILRFMAKRRCKKFEAQLPDVLTLVASSLSTGFSLLQALDAVAKDAAEPAAKEFSRALAETRIGADISDSLERMAERMDSTNMRWASMAIQIQRQVGGNLAETLRTTAKTLRGREELHRMVRTLSAEGRLSAMILIALPFFVFFWMLKVNYDYVSLLWTEPMGWALMVAGSITMTIGIIWMNKVVKVEV
jgi:tight adherence protein B